MGEINVRNLYLNVEKVHVCLRNEGLSLTELQNKLEVSSKRMSDLMAGKTLVTEYERDLLASVLGCEVLKIVK